MARTIGRIEKPKNPAEKQEVKGKETAKKVEVTKKE